MQNKNITIHNNKNNDGIPNNYMKQWPTLAWVNKVHKKI